MPIVTPETAVKLLSKGEVVALPTETVYGLAAAIKFPTAIKKIYTLKGRLATTP